MINFILRCVLIHGETSIYINRLKLLYLVPITFLIVCARVMLTARFDLFGIWYRGLQVAWGFVK